MTLTTAETFGLRLFTYTLGVAIATAVELWNPRRSKDDDISDAYTVETSQGAPRDEA